MHLNIYFVIYTDCSVDLYTFMNYAPWFEISIWYVDIMLAYSSTLVYYASASKPLAIFHVLTNHLVDCLFKRPSQQQKPQQRLTQ